MEDGTSSSQVIWRKSVKLSDTITVEWRLWDNGFKDSCTYENECQVSDTMWMPEIGRAHV
jgi:hypothetical protein